MTLVEWLRETHRAARPSLEAALAAAERRERAACAEAARQVALIHLRRFLLVSGPYVDSESVVSLLEEAARRDHYFTRLRGEAAVLDAGAESEADTDEVMEAMKEIRFLSQRAGELLGPAREADDSDPRLKQFLIHSTPAERARSIFAEGALHSFHECARRGLLRGEPVGAKELLDPRRCLDFVILGIPNDRYAAGEKVANSQRKGRLDESMEEDYQPSVRLFFSRDEIAGLPGFCDDGLHHHLVRDRVSLDLLLYAVFPGEEMRAAALAAVQHDEPRARLAPKCLLAPRDCCENPHRYVNGTNALVLGVSC